MVTVPFNVAFCGDELNGGEYDRTDQQQNQAGAENKNQKAKEKLGWFKWNGEDDVIHVLSLFAAPELCQRDTNSKVLS
jgi:hypothetical protein